MSMKRLLRISLTCSVCLCCKLQKRTTLFTLWPSLIYERKNSDFFHANFFNYFPFYFFPCSNSLFSIDLYSCNQVLRFLNISFYYYYYFQFWFLMIFMFKFYVDSCFLHISIHSFWIFLISFGWMSCLNLLNLYFLTFLFSWQHLSIDLNYRSIDPIQDE
jgi:hypothetical protein